LLTAIVFSKSEAKQEKNAPNSRPGAGSEVSLPVAPGHEPLPAPAIGTIR
jgi:hypothetical protein